MRRGLSSIPRSRGPLALAWLSAFVIACSQDLHEAPALSIPMENLAPSEGTSENQGFIAPQTDATNARREGRALRMSRKLTRIVIDPGHGGNDAGAVGTGGLREKDITLDLAHRVAPLLAHELQIDTLLTRDDDSFVPLELRVARANAFGADLFISLHCNASENVLARGIQTYVLDRTSNNSPPAIVLLENTRSRSNDSAMAELNPASAQQSSSKKTELSRHFAALLQRSTMASLQPIFSDTPDQGVRCAGFYVLTGSEMPSALFEALFLSNEEDESRLRRADVRQKLASAIVNAVRAYRLGI